MFNRLRRRLATIQRALVNLNGRRAQRAMAFARRVPMETGAVSDTG